MNIKTDGSGNTYIDIATTRVTRVSAKSRAPEKNWTEGDVLRLQAYRGEVGGPVHMGAEFAIDDPANVLALIEAIAVLSRT